MIRSAVYILLSNLLYVPFHHIARLNQATRLMSRIFPHIACICAVTEYRDDDDDDDDIFIILYVLYLLYLTYITLSTRALTIETASDAAPSLSLVEASALDGAKPM